MSTPPRSRPTGSASSPLPKTGLRGSGTRPRPGRSSSSPAMTVTSWAPRSRPTGGASSPPPKTRPRGSGTRSRPSRSPSSPVMTDFVQSPAFSPDGRRIVTASGDRTARIWDAATGKSIAVLSGHGDMVLSAAFSPDGRRIVTASEDKTARIWDADTAKPLAVLSGHRAPVRMAAFSPDGRASSPLPWTRRRRSGARPAACSSPCCPILATTLATPRIRPTGRRIVIAAASDDDQVAASGTRPRSSRSPDSPGMNVSSAASRSRPTGGASLLPPTTGLRASGMRPAARSSRFSPVMARASPPTTRAETCAAPCSRPTGGGSSPPPTTRPRASGTRPRADSSPYFRP